MFSEFTCRLHIQLCKIRSIFFYFSFDCQYLRHLRLYAKQLHSLMTTTPFFLILHSQFDRMKSEVIRQMKKTTIITTRNNELAIKIKMFMIQTYKSTTSFNSQLESEHEPKTNANAHYSLSICIYIILLVCSFAHSFAFLFHNSFNKTFRRT